jgi:tRNA-2-methylthio-N6-dimethylallyladenosine synthase
MKNQIDDNLKHNRFNRLVEVINTSAAKKNKEYNDTIQEVLVEGFSKNDDTKLSGRTRTGKLVNFEGNKDTIGKLVNVKINKTNAFSLTGKKI